MAQLDAMMKKCLHDLADDRHVRQWHAKENNWVSYFAFKYLVGACDTKGAVRAQIGVEVSANWEVSTDPLKDPLAIIEWKVHRLKRPNRLVAREREWLRAY